MGDGIHEADRIDAAFRVVWDHLVPEDGHESCDAVVCFGSRHWRVPARTASYYLSGLTRTVVVTGGTVEADGRVEADRIAHELIAAGVPPEALCVERRALNTFQNAQLAVADLALRRAAEGLDPTPGTLALVSWPLASLRCRSTLARIHPGIEVLSVPALAAPGRRWQPTPKRIRLALGELDRLDRYAASGHLVPVTCPDEVRHAAELLSQAVGGPAEGPGSGRAQRREAEPVGTVRPPATRAAAPSVSADATAAERSAVHSTGDLVVAT